MEVSFRRTSSIAVCEYLFGMFRTAHHTKQRTRLVLLRCLLALYEKNNITYSLVLSDGQTLSTRDPGLAQTRPRRRLARSPTRYLGSAFALLRAEKAAAAAVVAVFRHPRKICLYLVVPRSTTKKEHLRRTRKSTHRRCFHRHPHNGIAWSVAVGPHTRFPRGPVHHMKERQGCSNHARCEVPWGCLQVPWAKALVGSRTWVAAGGCRQVSSAETATMSPRARAALAASAAAKKRAAAKIALRAQTAWRSQFERLNPRPSWWSWRRRLASHAPN